MFFFSNFQKNQNSGGFYSPGFSGSGGAYCNITAYSNTIAASSSALVDCGAPTSSLAVIQNVKVTDKILVSLASTSPTSGSGLSIMWSQPSSTPGYISLRIYNGTGATFTWSSGVSSTVPYLDSK